MAPPIKVFLVGTSEINSQTQRGPRAVSKRKNIPICGELIYWGAILINTKETPTVIIIREVNIRSKPTIRNETTNGKANNAVKNLPKIYEGTKFISL